MNARIITIAKENEIETGNSYLDVSFEILDGEEVVASRKIAMPVESSVDEVKEALQKYVATHEADIEIAKASEHVEKENAHVEELKKLEGQTI